MLLTLVNYARASRRYTAALFYRNTGSKAYGMELRGKRVVITGATSGIGLELARQLGNENETVVIARPSPALEEFRQTMPDAAVFEADLACAEQVALCGEEILRRFDRLDGLINNAAVQHLPTFLDEDFAFETIAEEVTVNLTSPCQLCARLLPLLRQATEAFILNINSGLGLFPKTSSAVYCATKGGLNIFSQALANQLDGTNVKVMQAFLPLVDTRMTRGRGSGKLSAQETASRIISGVRQGRAQIDIGKVKLLRPIARCCPPLARHIMKSA